jgi:hypothetical protein
MELQLPNFPRGLICAAALTEMLRPNPLLGATMTASAHSHCDVLAIGLLITSTLRPFIALALIGMGFPRRSAAKLLIYWAARGSNLPL